MKIVSQIKAPIEYEMELFEKKFQLSMSSKISLLKLLESMLSIRSDTSGCISSNTGYKSNPLSSRGLNFVGGLPSKIRMMTIVF